MSQQYSGARIKHKHKTENGWQLSDLIPLEGELIIYDPDENYNYYRIKIGNGTSRLEQLPFVSSSNDFTDELKEKLEDLYTKDQLYTKEEVYPKNLVYTKDEVFTKDEIDTKINNAFDLKIITKIEDDALILLYDNIIGGTELISKITDDTLFFVIERR